MERKLTAGTAIVDISPPKGLRLRGYPHYPRFNTGIHDPLYGSCLFIDDGSNKVAIVGTDLVLLPRKMVMEIRKDISNKVDIREDHIMLSSSHTHSGPWTSKGISVDALTEDIGPDPEYVEELKKNLVDLVINASQNTFSAVLGVDSGVCGRDRDIGGNRRNPEGLTDPDVWTIGVKDSKGILRCCVVKYALHPTIIHGESTVVSADYPGGIRKYLCGKYPEMNFIFLQGTSGDQSSRYFRKGQTFQEVERFGTEIGKVAETVIEKMNYLSDINVFSKSVLVDIPIRKLPSLEEALKEEGRLRKKLETLKAKSVPYADLQTADLHHLGAEDTLGFVKFFASGKKLQAIEEDLPAEIQCIGMGECRIVGLQGEIFVEFGLRIKKESSAKKTIVVELANGVLPGYVCTQEAYAKDGYEAGASLVVPETGDVLVEKALELLRYCG
jgi:neutral ceramidase